MKELASSLVLRLIVLFSVGHMAEVNKNQV
jgi:hypothetical protein